MFIILYAVNEYVIRKMKLHLILFVVVDMLCVNFVFCWNPKKKNFFSTNWIFSEPRCGPIGASLSLSMQQCDVDAPQPIIDRRPSMSLFKWGGSQKRNDAPTPTAARQGLDYSIKSAFHITPNFIHTNFFFLVFTFI